LIVVVANITYSADYFTPVMLYIHEISIAKLPQNVNKGKMQCLSQRLWDFLNAQIVTLMQLAESQALVP